MNKGVAIYGVCLNIGPFVFAVPESTHVSEPLLPSHSFQHSIYPNILNLASHFFFFFFFLKLFLAVWSKTDWAEDKIVQKI